MPEPHTEPTLDRLVDYVKNELLEGAELEELTTETPLLEWGVLNSMQTARLVSWIREELGVQIPPTQVVSRNFQTLRTVAELVERLRTAAV